ncbi:MAG: HTTM domain-containing protein [Bacteroidota bacterium]
MTAGDTSRPLARLRAWLAAPEDPLVLGLFRIGFGLVMAASLVRFLVLRWAGPLYAEPAVRFTYPGFGWVQPLPLWALTAVLAVALVSALAFAVGRGWRVWVALFVATFTYVELIDATTYLNHYYFVTVVGLLMLALPMGAALVPGRAPRRSVPRWAVTALRVQIGLVYFLAGVAKLHPDWLVDAMPLRIWLPARSGLPVIGPLLDLEWMPWAFSWAGAAFDLLVPFALSVRRLRPWAYAAALVFHAMTYALFNIGVFPFVMMVAALVFFEADEWRALARRIRTLTGREFPRLGTEVGGVETRTPVRPSRWIARGVAIWLAVQLLLPFRHWLYPGDRFWTDEGYRFAWHVMVTQRTGTASFHVRDPASGREWTVLPSDDLTPLQEKQMAFQPDFIWQYAQHVEQRFREAGYANVEVRAEVYMSLNGRQSQPLIDPKVDLTSQPRGFGPKPWVLSHPDL